MKIRTGFVSNSSSMAYILIFDRPIESAHQLRNELFGDSMSITYNYDKIAEFIFSDLEKPNDWNSILCEIRELYFQRTPYEEYEKSKYSKLARFYGEGNKWKDKDNARKFRYYHALDRIKKKWKSRKLFLELCKQYDLKNKFSYIVEYEDGWGGDMYYHNGIAFENIDTIEVSHH